MAAFWLVVGLLAVGAVPILPMLLGKASRSPRSALRVPAKVLACVLLFVCFTITCGGLLASFVMVFSKLGDGVILGGGVAFVVAGAWLSYRIVFGSAESP